MVRLQLLDLLGKTKQEDGNEDCVCVYVCMLVFLHACAHVSHFLVLRQQFQQLFQGLRPVRFTVAMANVIHDHLIGSAAISNNYLRQKNTALLLNFKFVT